MRKQKGFTLIELLIVVAIIGIIAAIAIPNLLDAIERSRQKRTIGDLRNLAGAVQTFSTDNGGYPGPGGPAVAANIHAFSSTTFTPDYIQAIPAGDGWRAPYTYYSLGTITRPAGNIPAAVSIGFSLYSFGSDGVGGCVGCVAPAGGFVGVDVSALDPTSTAIAASAATNCYQSDICWINSAFVQVADGKQKKC